MAESAARTLLVNVPDPAELVAEMVRLAARAAVMEPDSEYARCYPPQPAFTRLGEIFPVGFARNGADPAIGRRVPELSGQAGLTDIGTEARVQMYLPADDPARPGAQHAPAGAEAGTGQPGPAC